MRISTRAALTSIAALAGGAIIGGAVFIYSGSYDVAATTPHFPITFKMLDTARIRSIRSHAAGITPPPDLGSQARVVAGTAHFAEHCAICHSAPGVEADDMADGMYPKPPVLTDAASRYTPGELFWILKNGIKMSGMPSWADHGDAELWNVVAFLEKLPLLTPEAYAQFVKRAAAAGGHHMHGGGGGADHGGMDMNGMDMHGTAGQASGGAPVRPGQQEP